LKGFFTAKDAKEREEKQREDLSANCANELQRKTLLDSHLFVAFADRGFPFALLRVLRG
jgi:hypothetical protein